MNREEYKRIADFHHDSGSRYAKVLEKMDLLGIMDISTTRQSKNGTIVWKLPIKNWNSGKTNIEVASFSTGYVRNQNSGYSNYQLNKRKFDDEYFQDWEYVNGKQVKIPGKYRKWSRKTCVLIPIEIDRLEYLISYCLKNYYIKNANQVADGKFVPKWKHDNEINRLEDYIEEKVNESYEDRYSDKYKTDKLIELRKEIRGLETQVSMYKGDVVPEWKYTDALTRIKDLENKLDTVQRISKYGEAE